MLKRLSPILSALLLMLSTAMCYGRPAKMLITDQGKASAIIVIAQDADPKARFAAGELQEYIEKISSAKLPIVTDAEKPQGSLILVGKSRLTDEMGIVVPSGMSNARREEAFVIVCKDNKLVLAGNDTKKQTGDTDMRTIPEYHGTEYAVYDFLNRLGVRWFMPGEYGEIVPKRLTISFPEMHINEKPTFVMRGWWCWMSPELQEQEIRWKIRNKMNPFWMFQVPTDGTADGLVPASVYFKDHPEYFALKADGTRNPNMPCVTNPKSIEIAAETIKEYFRTHPEANCYGFSPEDGYPHDYTPETLKQSTALTVKGGRPNLNLEFGTTDEWLIFVNKVTAEVRRDFPDVYIATNGYANRAIPPQGIELDDHMVIMYADIMTCTLHAYDNDRCWLRRTDAEGLKGWCELSKNVWVYNYEPMMVSLRTPLPDTRKVTRDFRLMKKLGSIGFYDEAQNVWAEYSIQGRYLRARLGWDPDADEKAILRDFYIGWYGKAAKPMQAFYDAIEDRIESAPIHGHEDRVLVGMYTPGLMENLSEYLTEAERLADTDRDREHVRADRLIYEHLKGYVGMLDAEASGDFASAIKWGDYMLSTKKKLHAINPFYCWHNEEGYESGVGYYRIKDRQEFFRSLLDKMSGKTGELIAILPDKARFRTDPYDEGIFGQWFKPGLKDSGWKQIRTTIPYYYQGYQDKEGHPDSTGYMWYRTELDLPVSAKGRKIVLQIPAVEAEAWVWVNGKYAGRRPWVDTYIRPIPMEVDITDRIIPGQTNTIALRVSTGFAPGQLPGGIVSRMFLYTPAVK